MSDLSLVFLLIATALVVSALVSALVLRGPISFPIIFLGLGLLLGALDEDRFHVGPHDAALEAVGIASLAFVLFLDALKLRVEDMRSDWRTPALVLGPGTGLTVAVISLAAWLLLGVPVEQAVLLGAILASTDAVVVRDIVRDRRLPRPIRNVLGLEAAINDVIVLPILLVVIAIAGAGVSGITGWLQFAVEVFLVGPLIGAAIAGSGAWLMMRVDRRLGVSREYQALFGVGLVLLVYVAGDAAGGDGFLAAFAGGLAILLFNEELCDCFMDFGETLVEMLMLLAFVLFGIALTGVIGDVELLPVLVLAAVAILVARPASMLLVLSRARIGMTGKLFLAWFGPRGLSSLLLALLVVQAGLPFAEYVLAVAGIVVIVSVLAHGVTATPAISAYDAQVARTTQPEERLVSAGDLLDPSPKKGGTMSAGELKQRLSGAQQPLLLDVRTRSQYALDPAGIPGGVRVSLDDLDGWAQTQSKARDIVTYCT